jgi:hypothetical protein
MNTTRSAWRGHSLVLDRIEPFGRMHRRLGIEQLDALTAGRQLLGKGARDDAVVYVLPYRKERYRPVRRFVAAAARGRPQAVHKLRYDRQH